MNQVDVGQKNQRSEDLLRLTVCIGLVVVGVAMLLIWSMFGQMAKNMKILLENVQRVARESLLCCQPILRGAGSWRWWH